MTPKQAKDAKRARQRASKAIRQTRSSFAAGPARVSDKYTSRCETTVRALKKRSKPKPNPAQDRDVTVKAEARPFKPCKVNTTKNATTPQREAMVMTKHRLRKIEEAREKYLEDLKIGNDEAASILAEGFDEAARLIAEGL